MPMIEMRIKFTMNFTIIATKITGLPNHTRNMYEHVKFEPCGKCMKILEKNVLFDAIFKI